MLQFRRSFEFRHVLPVIQNDGESSQRRPEFMRRARSQETHPYDMILLRCPLPELRHMGVACPQVTIDAANEQNEKDCRQQKANKHAFYVQAEKLPVMQMLGEDRLVNLCQQNEATAGPQAENPCGLSAQQHSRHCDLTQR